MNNYVRVSNELYNEFEIVARAKQECDLTYLNDNDEVNVKAKIDKLKSVDGAEFMDTENGMTIRLDKVIVLNGMETKPLNHY